MTEFIILLVICTIIYSILVVREHRARKEAERLQESYDKLLSQKKSSEVRLGQISEQLAPVLQGFKYDPKQTHFLGMPVDFIVFQPDKVVFLEVKSGKAQLNSRQKEIKQLILDKKVTWDEMRIDGKEPEVFHPVKLRETSGNSTLVETRTDSPVPVTNTPSELVTVVSVEPDTRAEEIQLGEGIKRQRMD